MGYKDELKYQREYARKRTQEAEERGTMTPRKRKAYSETIRKADLYAPEGGNGAAGQESYADAAKNLLQGLGRIGKIPKKLKGNLSDIEKKSRR